MRNILLLSLFITLTLHHTTLASGRGRKAALKGDPSAVAAPESDEYTPKRPRTDIPSPIWPAHTTDPSQAIGSILDGADETNESKASHEVVQGQNPPQDPENPMGIYLETPEEFLNAFTAAAQEEDQYAFLEHAIHRAFAFERIISLEDAHELNENLDDLIEIYESEISDSMSRIASMDATNSNLTLPDILSVVEPMVLFLKEKHMTDEGTTPLNTAEDYHKHLINLAHQSDPHNFLLYTFVYKNKFITPVREDIFSLMTSKETLNIEPYLAILDHFVKQVIQLPPGTADSDFNKLIRQLTQAVETQLMLQGHVLCLTENNFLRSHLKINDLWNFGQFIRISIHHNIYNESKKNPKKEATYIEQKQKLLQNALPYEEALSGDAQNVYRSALQGIFSHGLTADTIEHIKEQLKKLSSKLVSDMIVWNARK